MGWGSGSRLAGELIDIVKDVVSNSDERSEFYERMIEQFEEFDCDTLDECVGIDPSFDEVWKINHEGEYGAYWGIWDKEGNYKF